MPIAVACGCGQSLRVKDQFAGRKIRCRGCGSVLVVPRPQSAGDAEEEALRLLLTDSPAGRPAPRPQTDEAITPRREEPPPRQPPRQPARPAAPGKAPEKPRPQRAKASRRKSEESGGGIAVHPAIISGLLMMTGAAVWFFLGLAAGRIFFYPPVLFVLGIGAIIRGFTGRE